MASSTSHRRENKQNRLVFLRRGLHIILLSLVMIGFLPLLLIPAYTVVRPPVSTLMLWRMAEGERLQKNWAPLEEIAPALPLAVLSSEDSRFCSHSGVDWQSVQLVVEQWRDGRRTRGASTITMQLVKNLFLWPQRSYVRKGLEAPLALYADIVWSKRRTLELYLNTVEWGPGLYGAEAAAQHYFKRSAAGLTRAQAALLASALPNPRDRNPAQPGQLHQRLAKTIERRMQGAEQHFGCIL